MEESERRALEGHRNSLVSDLADVEPILDHLISCAVFRANGDEVQRIRAGETARMRARKLLDFLPSCGRAAFGHFVEALRKVRPHLADLLTTSLAESAGEECAKDFASPLGPPQLANPIARKLQDALCADHQNKARCLPLFDFQQTSQASGLDDVFVTLSALNFGDTQAVFHQRKSISAKQVREMASKTWSERQGGEAVEVTDLSRLLQFPNGRAARSCLLLARAAGGKTLTLLKMAALWADGDDGVLGQFEFVFYVSARDADALSGKSAIDVLRLEEFDLTPSQQEEMAEYLSENSHKVLVLIDGADEGGELWSQSKGLHKILQRKGSLRNCSFVVASRPCETAYHLVPKCEQHFHLVGLNDRHLKELLRRRLGEAEGQKLSDRLKEDQWSQLRALMAETPLVANMVTALSGSGLSLPETLTELYTVVIVNMARRARDKAQQSHFSGGTLDDLPDDAKATLAKVGKLALSGLMAGKYVFNLEKEVHPICGDMAELFGLLEEFHSVSLRGQRHEAQFCHLTYQEYLAAYAVSQAKNVEGQLESCQRKIGFGEETWSFWRFVGGLLGLEQVKVLTSFLGRACEGEEVLGMKRWQIFKMSCFAEAMGQPCPEDADRNALVGCRQEAASFLPDTLDLSSQAMSSSDIQAVAVSLAHAKQIQKLDVSFCNLRSRHCSLLSVHDGLHHILSLAAEGNPDLHGDGLVMLASALRQNGRLCELLLTDCRLDDDDCASLCAILDANPVSMLHLGQNNLSPVALKRLQPFLSTTDLELLDLSYSLGRLCSKDTQIVGDVVSHCGHLRHVNLSGNGLGNEGAEAVIRGVITACSRSGCFVSLNRTRVDDGLVESLSTLLHPSQATAEQQSEQPPSLPLLVELHSNRISLTALQRLASQLPFDSPHSIICGPVYIEDGVVHRRDLSAYFQHYEASGGRGELCLSNKSIGDEMVAQVVTQLKGDRCSIEALGLDANSLSDAGATMLAHALATNSKLRGLGLAYNNIHRPASLLSVVTTTNSSLQWLELCGNPIFDVSEGKRVRPIESRDRLARLVMESQGLKYIGLGRTGLGDEECRVLQAALSANSGSLTFISLGRNHITSEGATALAQGLEKNTSVRLVNLSHNEIDGDGAKALVQCMRVRELGGSSLQSVWMAGNKCDASHFGGCVVNSAFFYMDMMSAMESYLD